MTNTDFIKIMLTSIGYGRNIKIIKNKNTYDIYGESSYENNTFSYVCCSFYDFINEFVKFVKHNNVSFDFNFFDYPTKYIIDDELRHKIINEEIQKHKDIKSYLEKTKYITDYKTENNPCTNCNINKNDHWDDIHYNCEKFHNMTCSILKEFNNDVKSLYEEFEQNEIT